MRQVIPFNQVTGRWAQFGTVTSDVQVLITVDQWAAWGNPRDITVDVSAGNQVDAPRFEGDRPGPHSRACGIRLHPHGKQCNRNCPTCGGRDLTL